VNAQVEVLLREALARRGVNVSDIPRRGRPVKVRRMTMLHLFLEKGAWFRAKKYGYGAGLPIKWQGWALLAFYTLAVVGFGQLAAMPKWELRIFGLVMILLVTGGFLRISYHRTEGNWKWRSGDENEK
jgi:hypothetical protein